MTAQPQPEALAAGLEAFADHLPTYGFNVQTPLLAAAELRRLHAECETLRQANAAFAARQAWWNDRMVALEAECEELRMERDALRAAASNGGWMGYFDDAARAAKEQSK